MSDVETPDKTETKFDGEAFAMNIARAMESSGQALAAYLKPRETGEVKGKPPNEIAEVIKTFSSVAEYWMSDKDRAADLQHKIGKAYLDLWGSASRRMAGDGDVKPAIEPSPLAPPSLGSGTEASLPSGLPLPSSPQPALPFSPSRPVPKRRPRPRTRRQSK